MRFENSFEVAGTPQAVIALFADTPLMAGFLPGAAVGERNQDGGWPATLTVAFGPKRLIFRGTLTNTVDIGTSSGTAIGHASSDMRGAKMSVEMTYSLAPAPTGTLVTLVSEAELTGMLAEFARTGGVAVTQALLAQFAERFSAHVRARQQSSTGATVADAAAAAPQALSVFAVLRQMVKSALRSMWPRPKS